MAINSNLKGILLALFGFASYSFMDGFVKYFLTFTSLTWDVLIFYVTLLVLILLFFIILLSKNQTFEIKHPFWLFIRALIGVSSLNLVFFVLPKTNLDLFYSLIFISPIIASILAMFFLGEHLNIHKFISIIGGFIGILVITEPWKVLTWGVAIIIPLFCAFLDASIGIIARKYLINDKPLTLIFYQFILATIVTGSHTILNHKTIFLPEINLLLPIIIVATFTLCGYIGYIKAVQIAPIQIVLPMGYSQMVFGIIIGIVFFHYYPKFNTILGAIIIIIASSYITLYAAITKNK